MLAVLTKYIVQTTRIVGLIVLLQLSACHRSKDYSSTEDAPKLPCKVQGACDATINKYLTFFNKRGIKVVTMGQNYLISIPASALFADQAPHLTWASYGLLNHMAKFLKQFRMVAISINSYSSKYISPQREHALTLARSRVVSEYLWSQGIDSRIIFTQGLGSDKPVVSFTQGGDKSPNARVEITFRREVA
ncbi:MAG: type IVB secretion system protein IcmN/DotK [Legionellales bacterium]